VVVRPETVVRMATENAWRARKIQAELSKLGIRVSLATVSRYVPRPKPDPAPQQRWVIQQLRETFPEEPSHRFVLYDNDSIFSAAVTHAIDSFDICPKRTAFRCPWQNGAAERFVGSVRRELLDHAVVFNEDHLRGLLREYVDYYNAERVHTSIGDAPNGRAVEFRPSSCSKVIGLPRVGGLQHRYRWRDAA